MVRKITCVSISPAALPRRTTGSACARATCGAAMAAAPMRPVNRRRVIMVFPLARSLEKLDRRLLQRPRARRLAHDKVSDLHGALSVRAHHVRLDHEQHAGCNREWRQFAFDHG